MTLYTTTIIDRHYDAKTSVFSTEPAAFAFARKIARERCACEEDYEEISFDHDDSEQIVIIVYSSEDDHIIIAQCELDQPIS